MKLTRIHRIQGEGLHSPLAGERVRIRGVVTGQARRAFFVQDPAGGGVPTASDAICVFSPRSKTRIGSLVQIEGKVVDYQPHEDERPTTQLAAEKIEVVGKAGPRIEPIWLRGDLLAASAAELAERLNALEGMLVGIEKGATLIAPSNPYGDYVALPPDADLPPTQHHGVRIDPDCPLRWFPGFRLRHYASAPRADVGATLCDAVVGPLHYRVGSYQIAAGAAPAVEPGPKVPLATVPDPDDAHLTVLTLNGFNLDPKVERADRVADPRFDIDDDVGDGRYDMLARAIVDQARCPDVVALQEIQDDDGAEISEVVSASRNLRTLLSAVEAAGGPAYRWLDRPPTAGADGGQPGGNIRNAYLYRTDRVGLVEGSVERLGVDHGAFEDSRKPLAARFRFLPTKREIVLVNVHLASKRHQHSIFAPDEPGFDPREAMRIDQAAFIAGHLDHWEEQGLDTYTTGDFNDYEFSLSLRRLCAGRRTNLAERVPENERYDYNHRGVLQTLMHGLASPRLAAEGMAEYRILHGNELTGVQPGTMGSRPTDHAYVLARLCMEG